MRRSRTTALRLIPGIHRTTHQIGLHIARLADLGVTQAEAHILDHLASQGASTVGELHRAFAHRRSTLTSVLDRLAARELITREASTRDRRTFVIGLTSAGRVRATRLHDELRRLESRVLSSLSARDVKSFEEVLEAFERALRAGGKAD